MPADLISTRKARYAMGCSAAAMAALGALCGGCSRPTADIGAPRVTAAQAQPVPAVASATGAAGGMARLTAYAAPNAVTAAVAPAATRPAVRDPLAGDAMERELGTASDGGYFAYPAR